jgi:hypothetical protein
MTQWSIPTKADAKIHISPHFLDITPCFPTPRAGPCHSHFVYGANPGAQGNLELSLIF